MTTTDPIPIQILSDIHLEVPRYSIQVAHGLRYEFDFPVVAENLALLGDIGCTKDIRLLSWLEAQLRRFRRVFFVMGNHEPYGSSVVRLVQIPVRQRI